MSANPEAFEYLRKLAYGFVQKNGKGRQKLYDYCAVVLNQWRSGEGANSGLTDPDANQVVGAVTDWTITRYNPPRQKANRRREERAAAEISAPLLLEFAAETYGAATVRNASRISGQSKTTVARHLRQQGIAPARQKKISALSARLKWLAAILDETFPRDGAGLVLVDHLAAAVWDKVSEPLPETPRSTCSTRRKKLSEYVAAISGARLGFHLLISDDVVAIQRGRRFKGFKDTAIWIGDERRLNGIRTVRVPDGRPKEKLFWDDPWLNDVLDVLQIGEHPYFTDPSQLEPLLRLTRPLLDVRPLYHLFELVITKSLQDDFPSDLMGLSKRVHDSEIRQAAQSVAAYVGRLSERRQYEPHPIDCFDLAEHYLGFMGRVEQDAPQSYAILSYFRVIILEELLGEFAEEPGQMQSILNRCKQLREMERSGDWKAPSVDELAVYLPDNFPQF